jgi:hypothetical protein
MRLVFGAGGLVILSSRNPSLSGLFELVRGESVEDGRDVVAWPIIASPSQISHSFPRNFRDTSGLACFDGEQVHFKFLTK